MRRLAFVADRLVRAFAANRGVVLGDDNSSLTSWDCASEAGRNY